MTNFTESELIPLALKVIKNAPDGIDTKRLIKNLREEMKPNGDDIEVLLNRTDDKFSQKVRNLNSHKTLENKELATFYDNKFYITKKGIDYLKQLSETLNIIENISQNSENKDEHNEVLKTDILKEWPLSKRTYNVLKNENIRFVGDLLQYSLNDLLRFPNFGKNSLEEIKENLSKLDLDKCNANLSNWDEIREAHIYKIKFSEIDSNYTNNNQELTRRFKLSILKDYKSFKEKYLKLERIKINKNLSSVELEKLIIDDIEEIFSVINDKMNTLFRGRYAYLEDYKTLDTLGKKFGVTRERIRQNERDLNKSLSKLGKIDKNSLLEYFKKYEFISFHKLFPQLDKNFTDTAKGTGEITGDKLVIFMENYTGVEEEYFKTPERELWHFDKEKLKEIFLFTPSGLEHEEFIEVVKENYGYNTFVAKSAIEFMEKKELIKIKDKKIFPIDLKKNSEVVNILLNYPNGLHWKKISEIGSNSYSKNEWSKIRIMGDFSLNMASNSKIYLCERGTYKLLQFCPEISNREKIIDFFINYLKKNNKTQMAMEIIYKEIIKEKDFNKLNFYDARTIIKIFGKERGIFHSGRSGTNTVSLDKNIKSISLKSKINEIIDNAVGEISRNDIIEKLQKTDEDLPLETHLYDLVDEMKIFRISPGTYLNFDDAIKLCDKDQVKMVLDKELNNYEFILSGFIREKVNNDLGFNLSNFYYDTLSRILAKENNWFYGSNYLSKKTEKKMSVDKYIKKNFNENLSTNENFDEISKKIGISKLYFANIVYRLKDNFNTDWIFRDD